MKYYPIYLEEGFYMDFESVSFGTDQSFDLK
jgi:hypothetical protein